MSHVLGAVCSISGGHDECLSAHWQNIREGYFARLRYITKSAILLDPTSGFPSPSCLLVSGWGNKFGMAVRTDLMPQLYNNYSPYDSSFPSVAMAPHIAIADTLRQNYEIWTYAAVMDSDDEQDHSFTRRAESHYWTIVPAPIAHTRCYSRSISRQDGVKIPVFPQIILEDGQ